MAYNIDGNTAMSEEVLIENEQHERVEKRKNKKIIYRVIKRIVDIIGGLVGVILLIPITLVLKIVNLCSKENKGPVFYEQLRVGKDGKYFRIIKYRTMIIGADKILEKYLEENPEAKKEFKENHKLNNDPRITKIGKILRKTSIDELPQLINVLKGDMSLIGPRPLVKGELDSHGGNHEIYESVRPGITGWWGCNGRSATTYKQRLELEYYYIENRSLILDIKCIIKTVISIIKKEGAI